MRAAVIALERRCVRHPERTGHVDDTRAGCLGRRHDLETGRHRQTHDHHICAGDRFGRRQILKRQLRDALQIGVRGRHVLTHVILRPHPNHLRRWMPQEPAQQLRPREPGSTEQRDRGFGHWHYLGARRRPRQGQ
jgi:hypothetical protein